ncbi:MAG: hypothetical protein IT423_21240, partial [Pirellulaceae bacterium]|nr:hypothetical protein [Pirellulaceae bacterium]
METIAIECPNGHRLTGPAELVGRKVRCPKCATTFQLQVPAKKTLTETGVMRLLGDVTPVPAPPDETPKSTKNCNRCHLPISIHANVCEHCKCYVGVLPSFLSQMIAEGKS